MNHARNVIEMIGRILLAWFFVPGGIEKIIGYTGTATYMSAHGVPSLLLPLVIILEIGGGLLILFGWHTRLAAFLLGGFCLLAIAIFWLHPADQIGHIVQSAELAAAGGLWIFAARGVGPWSIDAWLGQRRSTTA